MKWKRTKSGRERTSAFWDLFRTLFVHCYFNEIKKINRFKSSHASPRGIFSTCEFNNHEFHSCRLTSSIYSATYFLTRTRAVVRVDVEICLLLTCTSATQKNHQNNLKIIWENNCCSFSNISVVNLTLLVQHTKVWKYMAKIPFIHC